MYSYRPTTNNWKIKVKVAHTIESTFNAGNLESIPGSGLFHGEENSNPLQYSCLENPMDRGAWQSLESPWHQKYQLPPNK